MPQRRVKWKRDEVYQVNQVWVKEHCYRVTGRDLELGKLLIKRRLLRRDQIPILHPGFRNLTNPEVQVNRRLWILFDCHFIDRAFPNVAPGCGSSQAVISLDRAGPTLLDIPFKRVIRHQKDKSGHITRVLPADYLHTLGINDFECALVPWCISNQAELLRWRIDFENARRFTFNGERIIRPDGFAIVRMANKKGRAFYFEYDTGSEDLRSRKRFKKLKEKFRSYATFKASGAWIQEDWAKLLKEFPPVIFLTEDKKRIKPLRNIAASLDVDIVVDHFENREKVLQSFLNGIGVTTL